MNLLSLYHNVDLENRKTVLDLIEVNERAKIMDLGCSDGEFALRIAQKAKTLNIFGVEFLKEAAQRARSRGIRVCQADLNEILPLAAESGQHGQQTKITDLEFFLFHDHHSTKVLGIAACGNGCRQIGEEGKHKRKRGPKPPCPLQRYRDQAAFLASRRAFT